MSVTGTKELIGYRVENGVAVFQLDDPPANTYSYEMMQQLDAAILRARLDESVHVVILRGAGDRFFCAGANIAMLRTASPQYKYYFCLHANETLVRLEQTPKLVIAALNGHTVGGGLEIALACDIRIARKDAGKIGLPEVTLGVLPGTGGTQRLLRVVGRARALEWMTTGRTMGFDEVRSGRREGTLEDARAESLCHQLVARRTILAFLLQPQSEGGSRPLGTAARR